MSFKTKVSVTVSEGLLREVDGLAGSGGRSAAVEAALELWLRSRRRAALDEAVERYYRSMSVEEALEDQSWAETSDAMVAESWTPYTKRSK